MGGDIPKRGVWAQLSPHSRPPYSEDVPTLGLCPTLVYNKPLQASRMVHHNQLTTVAPSTTSMGQIKMTSG